MAPRDKDADLASIERLIAYYEEQGNEAAAVDARRVRADIMADRDIIGGNPGNVPLHESLSSIADWVGYEAEVVKAAAGEIEEEDIAAAAVDQAEAMTEASAALSDAAKSAAETAAEAFVEDGTPAVDKAGEDNPEGQAVGGNPASWVAGPWTLFELEGGEWALQNASKTFKEAGSGGVERYQDEAAAKAAATALNKAIDGNPRDADVETQLKADLGAIDRLIAYWEGKDNAEALADAKSMRADMVKEMSKMGVAEGNPIEDVAEVIPDVKPDIAPETMHPYSRIWGKRNA